jgi:phosphopantothenoylcysteine decarboxylase / phosphopantothenate---cysteine ligase
VKIALGVTGCIAAYKSIEVMRGLQKAGGEVQVILTSSGLEFVKPLTYECLSGRNVITDMFPKGQNRDIQHISVAQSIQVLAVVPATANILGKFAHGIADDFLSTLYLATPAPVVIAPAMNVEMWRHPAVQENVNTLKARGHVLIDPEPGVLACGMEGDGKLASVEAIVQQILETLQQGESMAGLRVMVTAGPTLEDIDPVRYLSNRSSGKMGYAVAQAARRRGAEVVLISGPTSLPDPTGVTKIQVRSAEQMKHEVMSLYDSMDIVVKAAAVADYRPVERHDRKIKKDGAAMTLCLEPTEDILAILGRKKKRQILVGFAAETGNLMEFARDKLDRKNCDLLVANDVSCGIFGEDFSTIHLLDRDREIVMLENKPKTEIADRILDQALVIHRSRTTNK